MKRLKLGIFASFLALALSFGPSAGAAGIDDGSNLPGLGKVRDAWSRTIHPENIWSRIESTNNAGNQVTHLIDFNIHKQTLIPQVVYGSHVYGLNTLGSMVKTYEDMGYKVVFAINGDSFFGNGTPKGTMIKDGIIESTGASYLTSLGFDYDGKTVYGNPKIQVSAYIGNDRVPLSQINTERGANVDPAYILTDSFGTTTKSTKAGVEVVVNVKTSGYKGLKVNQTIEGTVDKVYRVGDNGNGNATPIKKGQVVLTTNKNGKFYSTLSGAKAGQKVTISVSSLDTENNWAKVRDAIGVFRPLREDGDNTKRAGETDIHPRTTVALRDDGFFRIMENDGRMGSAQGLSYQDNVNFLNVAGFDDIMAFDGGGSSTVYITLPGYDKAQRVNNPSDGSERRIGNALLFVKAKEEPTGIDVLHLYPKSQARTELVMDAGTSIPIEVRGTDADYDPIAIDPAQVVFKSDLGHGSGGVFYAGPTPGIGHITGVYPNDAQGRLRLKVNNQIVSISYGPGSISLAPGGETKLEIMADIPKRSYVLENPALTFEVSNPDLGSVSSNGVFKSSGLEGDGAILVSFGDKTLTIPLKVRAPKEIGRISGDNRYSTASAIGAKFEKSSHVLLANSGNFPDALVASVLADQLGAPILLSDGKTLAPETQKSIEALGASHITILGGPGSISGELGDALKAKGYRVERISGDNRYETAIRIGEKIDPQGLVYLASGENYPDALSITSLATKTNSPIILTGKESLPKASLDYILNKGIKKVVIAGGEGAVSKAVENTLRAKGITVERIAGANRYETSAKIARAAYPPANGYLISNGQGYIDALTAGPLAARWDRPILLVESKTLPQAAKDLLGQAAADKVTIIGGVNSVSDSVKGQIGALVK